MNSDRESPLTVIYLLGAGNSGSTLLSMALGGHPSIASVGELVQLNRWRAIRGLCSCGVDLDSCETWSGVLADYDREQIPSVVPRRRRLDFFRTFRRRYASDAKAESTALATVWVYRRIARKSGAECIVDASKDPLHFYYLWRSAQVRLVPVLLTRPGEQYMESALRRGRGHVSAILRWLRLNLAARRVLWELSGQVTPVHVSYNTFVREPARLLHEIAAAAGLNYDEEMIRFHEQAHHNIAGTRSRFSPRPIQVSNVKKLPKRDRFIFHLAGGGVWNRLFRA